MADNAGAVLITGCSTGIGRATAELLAREGQTVYATARRLESIEDLRQSGCRTLALDVTDEASMAAAVAAGGTLVRHTQRPLGWTLADPEGNEADVATCLGRD